jgi:hypothetical protein
MLLSCYSGVVKRSFIRKGAPLFTVRSESSSSDAQEERLLWLISTCSRIIQTPPPLFEARGRITVDAREKEFNRGYDAAGMD